MTPRWTEYHRDDTLRIRLERTVVGDRTFRRIAVGDSAAPGTGAVVVAQRDDGAVLLVRQQRPAVDRTLWELPRGSAEPEDADLGATGVRELQEETGVRPVSVRRLGPVHPDSGLLGSSVEVVTVEVHDATVTAGDGEVDGARWHAPDELTALIAAGWLRDAISLAALVVAGIL